MSGRYFSEYRRKLRTPDQAAQAVKSGDWVSYGTISTFPTLLDEALARRRDELFDVKVRGNLAFGPVQVAECDPSREHFVYHSWHCSAYERKLCDRGLCSFIPMIFRHLVPYHRHFLTVNVAMACVTPMDRHGYFNLSCSAGVAKGVLRSADIVIVEVNEQLPFIYGGFDESIHISDVDLIVEGDHPPLAQVPTPPAQPEDDRIADLILPHIVDGATLQLGIGSMPNVIGQRLAGSGLRDLGMHTELCSNAYFDLYKAGKLTNRRKTFQPEKGVTGMVFGSGELYDWVDRNPEVIVEPLEYVNMAEVIARHDNMVSINNCIAVDLFGQISSETAGFRQISGTGGQLDFLTGASMSRGGKAFVCMTSTFRDKGGELRSRIVPYFRGDIVTVPRSQSYYVVTEYGCVNLEGMSTWERAELLISIAHPDFRDALILDAEKQKIWRRTSRIR